MTFFLSINNKSEAVNIFNVSTRRRKVDSAQSPFLETKKTNGTSQKLLFTNMIHKVKLKTFPKNTSVFEKLPFHKKGFFFFFKL